jgi:uncharacterized protein YxeA
MTSTTCVYFGHIAQKRIIIIIIIIILIIIIIMDGAETWTLNTQQVNKLLATEMDVWRRSARKLRKEKVRNVTI